MIGVPVYTGGTVYQLNGGNASVGGLLPQRLDIDGHYNLSEKNTLFVGYSWTEYKMSKQLTLKGAVTDPITGQVTTLPNAVQNWHNMHEYKIGFETTHFDFATYRLGYTLTSQVTNDNNSSAKASTPDQYHHYAVGLTKQLTNRLSFDTAFEYYYAVGSGKSEGSDNGLIAVNSVKGNSMTEVYGVFGGLRYQY